VGIGYGLTCLFEGCDQYTWVDAGVDFGLGAATAGLSNISKLKHLGKVGQFAVRAGAEAGLDVGAEVVRHELKGEDYTLGQLAQGAVLNFGIGEGGGFAARKFAGSLSRAASVDLMPGNSWNNFEKTYGGAGFRSSGVLSMSNMYARRNSSVFPVFEGAARLRQGASRANRSLKRYLHIEDHHSISQNLWDKNPILRHAESLGISRHSSWNVSATWGHRGGHVSSYYSGVDALVTEAFAGRTVSAMSSDQIESVLAGVARTANRRVMWGRVPGLARMMNRPFLSLYR
jgi:hypothetical protein